MVAARTEPKVGQCNGYLDEWEHEHGAFTVAELEQAERELGLWVADPAA